MSAFYDYTIRLIPPRPRVAAVVVALIAAALVGGCGKGAEEDEERPKESRPVALVEASAMGTAVPPEASPAVVLHLLGFTEEGIGTEPLDPAGPGSYAIGRTVWTDAGAVAGLLARWDSLDAAGQANPHLGEEIEAEGPVNLEAAAQAGRRVVGESGERLLLGGEPTPIPARTHGDVVYAPVAPLARLFGALFHHHDPPDRDGRQVSGTIWPLPLLCWFGKMGDPQAPVFLQAKEQGLFAACKPDPSGRTRGPGYH